MDRNDDDRILLNRRELARAMGVSDRTVDRWIEDGCPCEQPGSNGVPYRFDVEQVRAWRDEIDRAKQAEKERREAAIREAQLELMGGENIGLPPDRALLEADMLRMKARKMRGELVEADDVRQTFEQCFAYLAQFLQALPDRLALQAGLDPAAQDALQTAVEDAQVELHRRMVGDEDDDDTVAA